MTGGRGFGTECPTLCASLGLKSVVDGLTGRDTITYCNMLTDSGLSLVVGLARRFSYSRNLNN